MNHDPRVGVVTGIQRDEGNLEQTECQELGSKYTVGPMGRYIGQFQHYRQEEKLKFGLMQVQLGLM